MIVMDLGTNLLLMHSLIEELVLKTHIAVRTLASAKTQKLWVH